MDRDLLLLGQFAQFSHKMEDRPMEASELHQYFGTEHISDLIEALQQREGSDYLEFEMKLSPDYLRQVRHKVDRADANELWNYDEHYGLGRLYDKVDSQSPLTTADISYLSGKLSGNKLEEYLRFTFTKINQQKFQDKLDRRIAKHQNPTPEIAPGISVKHPRVPEFKILNGQLQPPAPRPDATHTAMVMLRSKDLRLCLDGRLHPQPLKRYKTTKADTLRACQRLNRIPFKPLNREKLGIKGSSSLKDLRDNMGFKGIIGELFIFHDSQNKTLTLNKSVELEQEQYEAVCAYLVKLSKEKDSVT